MRIRTHVATALLAGLLALTGVACADDAGDEGGADTTETGPTVEPGTDDTGATPGETGDDMTETGDDMTDMTETSDDMTDMTETGDDMTETGDDMTETGDDMTETGDDATRGGLTPTPTDATA
jgi:hypothetical protein